MPRGTTPSAKVKPNKLRGRGLLDDAKIDNYFDSFKFSSTFFTACDASSGVTVM